MDKPGTNQSKKNEQAPKSTGASSSVLSILKRFRNRREASEEQQPFNERLGAATGPLSEKISEISSRIEESRARGDHAVKPPGTGAKKGYGDVLGPQRSGAGGIEQPEGADKASDEADTLPAPRVRAMGFHNPVFQPKEPDGVTDPDFKASTEPPAMKIFDAPDGVMENSGAPERRITPPHHKTAEPFDLDAFAEHLRSSLPSGTSDGPAIGATDKIGAGTEAQAAEFKKQFHTRLQKASTASAFVSFPVESPLPAPKPANTQNLRLREATAHSALQSWRELQSATRSERNESVIPQEIDTEEAVADPDPAAPGNAIEPDHTAFNTDAGTGEQAVWPASTEPVEPQSEDAPLPEAKTDAALSVYDQTDLPASEPPADDRYFARNPGPLSYEHPAPAPETGEPVEPAPAPQLDPDPDTIETFEQATSPELPAAQTEDDAPRDITETQEDPPDNIFAALDLDEDEILLKVYDLIQSELQAAWGENITLNVRKMVRQEIRAAIQKARSEV